MNTKLPVYPAIIIACLLGLVGLLLVWLRFNLSIELAQVSCRSCLRQTLESAPPETASLPSAVVHELRVPIAENATSAVPTPVAKPTEPMEQETPVPGANPTPTDLSLRQGALRVSNQTNQPLRLALLARRSVVAASGQPTYSNPAHWDFAPEEGSRKGLVLSLPDGDFKLKPGDILVAFAQDGSRRYWGPYVVGETPLPVWNNQGEWQLVLK
ncbi:MAG: hypothetical protein JO235_02525 [Chroococcidiopsidaceae cyanobacterium CP_BM_RX_35]|nr:hypothetical protein [Chroococcidiopsidaceae cyanobacterium CP_BM_RX_35]